MPGEQRAYRTFLILWTLVTAVKLLVAARLPLFVDEAFYWQEGQHLAAAYSDLPGMTAWLTRLGVALGGHHLLALRFPFLVIAAAIPWLIASVARRWFGAQAGWQAGCLTLVMPLSATLGVLAVPDVPMALAAVLCLDAGARLLREVDAITALELAAGLLLGALSHYRFVGVIGVGFIALMFMPQGRQVLKDVRVWMALAIGVAAWLPLLFWNFRHDDAGLRFQLVDRHPWSFHVDGAWFLLIQAGLVTPLLAVAMIRVALAGMRRGGGIRVQWRYFGLIGAVSTVAIFVLGFFSDRDRISFHWPLPGYLGLIVAVPVVLMRWPAFWRRATWGLAGLGMLGAFAYYIAVSLPSIREHAAGDKYYPRNFAGWRPLAAAVQRRMAEMPPGTKILAGNFKVGAELGFRLQNPNIEVLPAPLNDKHGRTPELAQWGLLSTGERDTRRLLILSPSDQRYRDLLQRYHQVCELVGPLPPPQVVSSDHGYQRFLLFDLPAQRLPGPCVTPAMAWVDAPVPHVSVLQGETLDVRGWAFKDGVGLDRVEILVDGRPATSAHYGLALDVRPFWKISTDPNHPRVGFDAKLQTGSFTPGRHWLGLRLHGQDGSSEVWWEQPFRVSSP